MKYNLDKFAVMFGYLGKAASQSNRPVFASDGGGRLSAEEQVAEIERKVSVRLAVRKSYLCGVGLILLLGTALPRNAFSQQVVGSAAVDDGIDMNIAKINVLALPFRNFSLQYERLVSRKISVAVGVRLIPKGAFPLLNAFESYIDDEETFNELQNLRVSNQAITIEPRFYFGRHDGPRGFYIAPYARYSSYGLGFDRFEYTVGLETEEGDYREETHTMALDGNINGFTGGVLFGCQWRIARWVYLDWWILGPAYGAAKGKLSGVAPLTPVAQSALRDELNALEIPMVKTEAHVDASGARLDMKGPWAGVRAGLAVGMRF